jgi:hypothetical protein
MQFEVVNTTSVANRYLRPVGQPHLFFKRLRVIAGGQVVEDIQDFGRNSELIASLQNDHVRDNDDIQGFGNRWDNDSVLALDDLPDIGGTAQAEVNAFYKMSTKMKQRDLLPAIAPGKSKIVNFRPLCGLLQQHHLIPLKFVPLVFEFELGEQDDAVISGIEFTEESGYLDIYDGSNTGHSWQIQNACIKCDILTLDSSLNNSFIQHLLSGKSLPLKYQTFISQQTSVVGKSFSVQVIRAVTKLQKAFITFYKGSAVERPFHKPNIYFYHPMATSSGVYNPDQELQIALQLGSKLYPEYPTTNISECFYRLKEAMNLPDYHQHSIAIKFKNYIHNKFIYCTDFQKVSDASWSGVNTKSGQVLMVNVKAVNSAGIAENDIADTMYTLLQAEQILEIRDVGCTVYD